jgi:glycosyltransferase involved in cell wall biosynthesis
MRVVIDLQACQAGSRFRGIGRYSMSLAHALVDEHILRGNDVVIALNGAFPNEADYIRQTFDARHSGLRYFEFSIVTPCAAKNEANQWRQLASRLLRERALASLEADMVHVTTLLADGWQDDSVASVGFLGVHLPTVLTHYDLIPLVLSDIYMPSGEAFERYYMEKLANVQKADLLFAISEYTRMEAITWLKRSQTDVVNISSAVNEDFTINASCQSNVGDTLKKFDIPPEFLLYAPGGFDPRKNVENLLKAYSMLSTDIRAKHKLVIASKISSDLRDGLIWKANTFGLMPGELIFTNYVSEQELINLYRACRVYVFPSLHEGFGLPVLEAMSCGAVVIASNCTSIPEAHGAAEALFAPTDPRSIAMKISAALTDQSFRHRLKIHAAEHPKKFSWARSARVAADAMDKLNTKLVESGWQRPSADCLPSEETMLEVLSKLNLAVAPNDCDLARFHQCFELNAKGLLL